MKEIGGGMTFKELKQWATKNGYEVLKEKGTERCVWTKVDDPKVSGLTITLSECATEIFNHFTDYKWLEYQKEYAQEKESKEFKW